MSESTSSGNPRPTISLNIRHLLCARHGEPYRARWPRGYLTTTLKLMDLVAAQPQFVAEVGGVWNNTTVLQTLLKKPACCRVGLDQLLAVYLESGIGMTGVCGSCHRVGLGTPYKIQNQLQVLDFKHVCFDCVLHRLIVTNMILDWRRFIRPNN